MHLRSALWACIVMAGITLAESAEASGPHFMAEGNLGPVTGLSDAASTEAGLTAGLLLGVGGRFKGTLPRFYFMVEYLTAGFERSHAQNLRPIDMSRRLHEVGLVGRVLLPLVPQLRLFGDLGVMAVHSHTRFRGPYLALEESSQLGIGLRFALGAQYRPAERFSLGLRLALTATPEGYDSRAARGWLVGFESEAGHAEGTLQLTVYF